jgi:hypothetical protein
MLVPTIQEHTHGCSQFLSKKKKKAQTDRWGITDLTAPQNEWAWSIFRRKLGTIALPQEHSKAHPAYNRLPNN